MKGLRHPAVVAALVVAALGLAAWNIYRGLHPRRPTPKRTASAQPTTPPRPASPQVSAGLSPANATPLPLSPVPNPKSASTTAPSPAIPVETAAIRDRLQRWIEAPSRDPFGDYLATPTHPRGPAARELLTLQAVWRQSGGQLAVLNRTVLAEGDRIAGFTLERIEPDGVWVRGSNGTERVEFALRASPKSPRSDAHAVASAATGLAGGTRTSSP